MTPEQKSIAASIVLGLAVFQLVAISVTRGWLGRATQDTRRRTALWHRVEGYLTIAIILVIAYYCSKLAQGGVRTARVYIHVVLGISVIGLASAKVAIMRLFPRKYPRMPLLGALLLAAIIATWISSAGWYFLVQSGGY